jgi:copper chaperone
MRRFYIPGMTCGGCLGAVTKAIQKLDSQTRIEGNPENRTITAVTDKAEAFPAHRSGEGWLPGSSSFRR